MRLARRVVFEMDVHAVEVYQAGQRVPPGTYRPLEGGREVRLEREDMLPATCAAHRPGTSGRSKRTPDDAEWRRDRKVMSQQEMPEPMRPVMEDLESGLNFYGLGDNSAAVRCYHRALCREPGSALAHYLLGLALMARGAAGNARTEWARSSTG